MDEHQHPEQTNMYVTWYSTVTATGSPGWADTRCFGEMYCRLQHNENKLLDFSPTVLRKVFATSKNNHKTWLSLGQYTVGLSRECYRISSKIDTFLLYFKLKWNLRALWIMNDTFNGLIILYFYSCWNFSEHDINNILPQTSDQHTQRQERLLLQLTML